MNCTIPYTKEIVFKNKIAEITSISLEHEMSINETELLGNFIVSGEYKNHELSVNKEEFNHVLPFSIELSDNVDLHTIDFSITDFSYEIVEENTLKVFIEFNVIAAEKEIIDENENKSDEIFQDVSTAVENDIVLPEVIGNNLREEEINMIEEENSILEERIDSIETDSIIDSIKSENEEYSLYHIHIVKETETIEAISNMYNTSVDLINEYNDLSNVTIGDKLIIPEEKDE